MSTIRDVAKLANVSAATVSRVLNQDSTYKITEETKQRVYRAVEELDYKFQSRSIRPRESDAAKDPALVKIGCIMSVTRRKYSDPYFMAILSGAEEQLSSKGYSISFIRAVNELNDKNLLQSTFAEDVTGLLLMETLNSDIYQYIRDRVPHIVGIDTSRNDIDNVGYDHHQVALDGTQYLIGRGHEKIGFIGGSGELGRLILSRRFQGYVLAMYAAGLEVNPEWVIDCEWDEEICAAKVSELCRKGDLPTAFFVASDLMAIAAINALAENGVSVPGDVAVIGMSDIEIARFTTPALTTYRVPKEEIGALAARLLIERINGSTVLPQKVTLPSELILRGSV